MQGACLPAVLLVLLLCSSQQLARGVHAAEAECGLCPPRNRCTLRVLAVGDSLTRGMVPSGSPHPYSIKLTEVLRSKLGQRAANVQVTTAGLDYMGVIQKARDASGRELDQTMVPFAVQQLQQARSAGQRYQWGVVLGGINDLGNSNQTAAAVMPKLIQIYDMLLASGANVIAVQLWPNRFVSRNSENERQRQLLNTMMAEYVNGPTNRARAGPRVLLQALPADSFDFWAMPEGRVAQMQDDLLHLKPYGYDVLGGLIADTILAHTSPTQCLCPTPCSGTVAAAAHSNAGRRNNLLASWRLPYPFRSGGGGNGA